MSRTVRLRLWQKSALERFDAATGADFLAVATPGAGKTTFALTAAIRALADRAGRGVVVVAPTQHLKAQWATAAAAFGLHLDPAWSGRDGRVPADMHGVVVTYQQVAGDPEPLRRAAEGAFVVLDEVHHAGEERAWGDGLRRAFAGAARRLSLSGTPFRSDTNAIPFVRYVADEAEADFVYGYGDALADRGVVRPVFFPRTGGEMEWTAPDGTHHSATFEDPLSRQRANQRLRTALSLDGEWLPAVLARAHAQLLEVRRTHPEAGGLVIAIDQEHARGIARLLRDRLGVEPVLALSEDADASARITRFAGSSAPWIVAVRMVSEGVDIPRLRVGVYATTTTTELFFRQAVGRLVRYTRGLGRQPAYLHIPDDLRLREYAVGIVEQRTHSLRRRETDEDEVVPAEEAELATAQQVDDEQLSLFAAISAVAGEAAADLGHGPAGEVDDEPDDDASLMLELIPPPLAGGQDAPTSGVGTATRRERKTSLRARNADRARVLVQFTGLTHAQVNTELNRRAGIRRISEATVDQLESRLDVADRWLRRL